MKSLFPISLLSLLSPTSNAAIATISSSTPTSTDYFSDGQRDYFGVVSGGLIEDSSFISTNISPPEGSLTGRDHDDGNSRPELVTATWTLGLPNSAASGTGFTNISFSANIAAAALSWANTPGDVDSIQFELFINGAIAETRQFLPDVASGGIGGNLALDTNNDGIGDGLQLTPTGVLFSINHGGGTSINSVVLRGSFKSDLGAEEHWTLGTLSADFDQVPEPSSISLTLLTLSVLTLRRRR